MLQPHTIKAVSGSRYKSKRVGRGNASGKGSYSGRGGKGQTARSGGAGGLKLKGFRRLMLSTPKLGGFRSLVAKPVEVRLSDLNKYYQAGETVTLETLKEKKVISKNSKSAKIILSGELKNKLSVSGVKVTAGAKAAIEKAGGEVK